MQQPLWEAGPESIALTFTETQDISQSQVGMEHPTFGVDPRPSLGNSVLASIIPGLDPDPPDPSLKRATSSAFGAAPGSPRRARVSEGPRDWAGGQGHVPDTASSPSPVLLSRPGEGKGGAGRRVRRRPVKHGQRVLLRGITRCGKSSILFDYCHRAAMAGHIVVLVCLRRDDENLVHLPFSMGSAAASGQRDELRGWEPSALSRIHLKYVRSCDDLAWYLGSLHTLPQEHWPTVIAVDDLDKIVDASAAGHISNASPAGGAPNGGEGAAAALRVLALAQDAAEFFDESRAGALATTAASLDATSTLGEAGAVLRSPAAYTRPRTEDTVRTSPAIRDQSGLNKSCREDGPGRAIGSEAFPSEVLDPEAVRVVATCSISDRSLLSLYGRFVHVVARVQNTTGPDCFSVRVDPGLGTAHGHIAQKEGDAHDKHRTRAGEGNEMVVEFVRSQLDGSFAIF